MPKVSQVDETFRPELDGYGHEVPDPNPVQIPAGFKKPETLADTVARLLRRASQEAAEAGGETLEEADDFDVGDDFDPSSPYELFFDPVLGRETSLKDLTDPVTVERYRQEALQRMRNYYRSMEEEFAIRPGQGNPVAPPQRQTTGDGGEPPSNAQKGA